MSEFIIFAVMTLLNNFIMLDYIRHTQLDSYSDGFLDGAERVIRGDYTVIDALKKLKKKMD